MIKYFAFDFDAGETEFFSNLNATLKWVADAIDDHHVEGIGEEAQNGGIGWGEIKQVTRWRITDRRDDYDARGEEWPFDDIFDEIGPLELVEVTPDRIQEDTQSWSTISRN